MLRKLVLLRAKLRAGSGRGGGHVTPALAPEDDDSPDLVTTLDAITESLADVQTALPTVEAYVCLPLPARARCGACG